MKLYLVEEDHEDSYQTVGIFSSYEKARAAIPDDQWYDETKKTCPWFQRFIVEYEIDQVLETTYKREET